MNKTMTNQPKADYNTPKEQLDKEQEKLYRLEQARSLEDLVLSAKLDGSHSSETLNLCLLCSGAGERSWIL